MHQQVTTVSTPSRKGETMTNHSEARTVIEAIVFVVMVGGFFFDIVGVFGIAFAIAGMLLAVAGAIAVFCKRPLGDQAR